MSANDSRPFGEVNLDSSTDSSADSSHFVSPNITDAAEEEQKAQAQAVAEQRQAETVNIDGIPIADQDIQYKTRDIVAKKADAKYFVNVKEEEDAAKAQVHQAKAAQRKTRWRRYGRPILVVAIVLILAVAGGFAARYFLDRQDEEAKVAIEQEKENAANEASSFFKLLDAADEHLEESDLDNADSYYEQAISMATTDKLRSYVYVRRSRKMADLMYDSQSERVYNDALKAYELSPDYYDALWWLAEVYERRGDIEAAQRINSELDAIEPDIDIDEEGETGEG